MDLWTLTGAAWPLSRKYLVADLGPRALSLPSQTLIKKLKTQGGVGLVAATQPRGVQAFVLVDGESQYAKKSANPHEFWVYYECASGWCVTKTRDWHPDVPTRHVPVVSISKPRERLLIGPVLPKPEAMARIGTPSLRTLTMLYLTDIYMQGRVLYWKDLDVLRQDDVNFGQVENYFGDLPKFRPLLMTVNLASVLVTDQQLVRMFDPILDQEAIRIIKWHAEQAGLRFEQVNSQLKPLEDTYWFVAGKRIDRLLDIGRFGLEDLRSKGYDVVI
jgi:hypothetical protein